ncbi:MAG: hypothetical protein OEQ74_00335 [Gammaproteobacteria bacterium]|nr:hypothetical protein [Gammaproteobacteria bacterium]
MNATRLIFVATCLLGLCVNGFAAAEQLDLEPLDLERNCADCHEVATPGGLTGADWLARMRAMGPVESLDAKQRSEAVDFLRHHGSDVNQILSVTDERYLFEEKCGLCHSVQRVFIKPMDTNQLRDVIKRMRKRAPQWLSKDEVKTIVGFMAAGARGVARPEHNAISGGPEEVFRGRCAGCHPLERSYLYLETELDPAWALLVKRMQLKAPDWISDDEASKVVEYLSGLKPQLR